MSKKEEMALMGRLFGGNLQRNLLQMLAEAGQPQQVPNMTVQRTGDKIILPEGADINDVIESLERRRDFEDQSTTIHVTIPVAPWDGAHALQLAINQELGLFNQMSSLDGNAHQIDIEVEFGKTVQIPWGKFELPGMDEAVVRTGTAMEDGRLVFQCHVSCLRKHEPRIRRLLDTVREIALTQSLHKGKAFSISFTDGSGNTIEMPKPKFFALTPDEPIFRKDLQSSIERNVFVPIKLAAERKAHGMSLKRGVLFAGEYGVGKTLLASYIARTAIAAGWTFIYVKNSAELPQALQWAMQYQPVVVFAEDVERVAGLDRTEKVNTLLNQLDGVDGKASEILTVLTTNHSDRINAAMRRPGRIDLVVPVLPPDAETVERMVRAFAGASLDAGEDLTNVGTILEGQIPARVREAVNRAELEASRRTGKVTSLITAADLETVAMEVKQEGLLFTQETATSKDERGLTAVAEGFSSLGTQLKRTLNGSGNHARTQ